MPFFSNNQYAIGDRVLFLALEKITGNNRGTNRYIGSNSWPAFVRAEQNDGPLVRTVLVEGVVYETRRSFIDPSDLYGPARATPIATAISIFHSPSADDIARINSDYTNNMVDYSSTMSLDRDTVAGRVAAIKIKHADMAEGTLKLLESLTVPMLVGSKSYRDMLKDVATAAGQGELANNIGLLPSREAVVIALQAAGILFKPLSENSPVFGDPLDDVDDEVFNNAVELMTANITERHDDYDDGDREENE